MRIGIRSLAGSGLLLGALALGAQQYYPQQYPPQGDYQRYDRGRDHNRLLNRVRMDLDRAEDQAYFGDRWRIARAKDMLSDFQNRMNSGNIDGRSLRVAIDQLQRVVDSNRLPSRSHDFLSDDLSQLRNLQYRLGVS